MLGDNAVVASHPLAAQAGLRMLADGGNAVDAAIAAAAVIAVVEPTNNGLGADAFALVWHDGRVRGINGSGRSPAGWTDAYLEKLARIPERGWGSVTTPGAVSVWSELARAHAKLPFEQLLAPAVAYASNGFPVSPGVAQKWVEQAPLLASEPGFAECFLTRGRAPRVGERVRFPDLADTLTRIATTCGRDFYEGETASRIDDFARRTGGTLRAQDLAAHRAEWVEPLSLDYRGWQVHEMPPNGQGIVTIMALGMLAHIDMGRLDPDGAQAMHWQIEAIKLAFADAHRHLADPSAMRCDPAAMLDAAYLRSRAALIDPDRAQTFGAGAPPVAGTVYLATADASGMMVSLIQSNYMGFGSGVVVPGTGVSLQNRGAGFTLEAGHPNRAGASKRPFHTILPGFALRGDSGRMAFGSTGGVFQPQGHVQLMVRLADHDQNPQAIIDAPRFRVGSDGAVNLEPGVSPATAAALAAKGHSVRALTQSGWDFGGMQIVHRLDDTYLAACDPRRDSLAVVC